MAYTLKVNGASKTVEAAADTPLLWVLRDNLNLVGSKYGCGIGACGACTVHIDGKAVRSCQVQVSKATGAITTIEGMMKDDRLSTLQRAWIDLDVAQCGYCQAGQIMSAAALLAQTPVPTDEQIDTAMSGNLCRCATYTRIRAAIHRAAGTKSASEQETVHAGG